MGSLTPETTGSTRKQDSLADSRITSYSPERGSIKSGFSLAIVVLCLACAWWIPKSNLAKFAKNSRNKEKVKSAQDLITQHKENALAREKLAVDFNEPLTDLTKLTLRDAQLTEISRHFLKDFLNDLNFQGKMNLALPIFKDGKMSFEIKTASMKNPTDGLTYNYENLRFDFSDGAEIDSSQTGKATNAIKVSIVAEKISHMDRPEAIGTSKILVDRNVATTITLLNYPDQETLLRGLSADKRLVKIGDSGSSLTAKINGNSPHQLNFNQKLFPIRYHKED